MFKNLWNEKDKNSYVKKINNSLFSYDLGTRVYSSRIIGKISDLVMHGGGNTSCKTIQEDIFGNKIDVLCIKGSGWDLDTIEAPGLPAVRLDPLLKLRNLNSLSDEDMVNLQRANLMLSTSPNPSVETLLHAFLPHKFVDHTHATPFLVLANLKNYKEITEEVFGNKFCIVPYIMPGFKLSKKAIEIYEKNKDTEAMLLVNHGYFTWGDTAKSSYEKVIEHSNKLDAFLSKNKKVYQAKSVKKNNFNYQDFISIFRKNILKHSDDTSYSPIFDLRNDNFALDFMERKDLLQLSKKGVSSPDHVIRIKKEPIILNFSDNNFETELSKKIIAYKNNYIKYFKGNSSKQKGSYVMLDPTPNIAWVKGVGLIGIGSNKRNSIIAGDIGLQNIKVMSKCVDLGGYYPINDNNHFQMEYWSLEQAKLKLSKPKSLNGKIVMVTGAGGTIGREISKKFSEEGANLFLIDINEKSLMETSAQIKNESYSLVADITKQRDLKKVIKHCLSYFGGIDILISNAGIAIEKPFIDLDEKLLRKSFEINFFAHYNLSQLVSKVLIDQNSGGDIIFNVTKQAVNPGLNFGSYGLPKASLFFLVKQLALELGKYNIKVNGINADKIKSGLLNDKLIKARSKSRGVSEEKYMKGNLLKKEVLAEDVAKGFLSLVKSKKTTAHVFTVDGGNIESSLR